MLSPRRLKGLGAFGAAFGIYTYLPWLYCYIGTSIPMVAACASVVYGMFAFAQ